MQRRLYLGELQTPAASPGCTILTPNENAARTLGILPLSLEGLAQLTLGEGRVANPILAQRLLREAVENVLDSTDPAGVARSLLPAIRELLRADADLETEPSSTRARRALTVARAYRRLLREQNLVDPAETLQEAARLSPRRRPVQVYGYPRFGAAEVAFLDAVAGDGSVAFLPFADDALFAENLEAAKALEDRGWTVQTTPSPDTWSPRVPTTAHVYPHLEAEVRGVLAQVKALLTDGASYEDLVIVARDDAFYGPTVLSVAREYGVPVRAFYRLPLAETRVSDWLRLLLEAASDGYPFESTARLLAHPLGPGMPEKDWPHVRKTRPAGLQAWSEAGMPLPTTWPHGWPLEKTRAGWLGRLDALLDANDFGRKTSSWRSEVIALMNLKNAAAWLGEPEEEVLSRADFLRELEELLYVAATPAHSEREGVALHTPLSLFGARYRHIFTLGLVEGAFPAHAADDPALDFYEREKLRNESGIRLELADERARRERLSFWMLLQVPEERLTLSYPSLVDPRAALPSPYFGLLSAEPVPPGPLPAASPEEARRAYLRTETFEDPVLPWALHAWQVERRRESAAPFDLYDGVTSIPVDHVSRRFSVSELGDLARCGFKWWAGSLLKLREPEEGGESPALFGSFYHEALRCAVERARSRLQESGASPQGWREAVSECPQEAAEEAEAHLEMHQLRAWKLRRASHLEMLRRAVEGEGFALPGAEATASETSFEGEWRGFQVKGRVDRVDRIQGDLAFVDYKTSGSVPSPDLQLSIYREAAAQVLFPDDVVKDAYYYSLRAGERVRAKRSDDDKLDRVVDEIRANLDAGHLPPDSLERDPLQAVCRWCAFDLVCRRGPRLDRKLDLEAEP